jgi:hypothetical protein
LRIEILPTNVAWRPASPSSKGSNPPETHQSGREQFEDVPRGVDVPVPEVSTGSTVGAAQDVPGALECDLHARDTELPHLLDLLHRLLGGCSFVRVSTSSFLCIFMKSWAFFRCLWQLEHVALDRNSSIRTTAARFFSAAGD